MENEVMQLICLIGSCLIACISGIVNFIRTGKVGSKVDCILCSKSHSSDTCAGSVDSTSSAQAPAILPEQSVKSCSECVELTEEEKKKLKHICEVL